MDNTFATMSNNTSRAKTFPKTTVIIGITACVLMALAYLFPWVTQFGGGFSMFSQMLYKADPTYRILAILSMLCYIGAAVLFVFDHPKLSLLPSIPGFMIFLVLYMAVRDGVDRAMTAGITVWPAIQWILAVLVIVMAVVSKRVHPKSRKEKIRQ